MPNKNSKKPSAAKQSKPREPKQGVTPSKKRKRRTRAEARAVRGLPDTPKCSARRHDGSPCKNYAVRGTTVCRMHGGAAPQVKAKANLRLLSMVLPAITQLREIVESPTTSDTDKLRAIGMILNRTGFAEKQDIEVGLRPPNRFEQLAAEFGDSLTIEFDRTELSVTGSDDADNPQLGDGGGGPTEEELNEFLAARKRAREREASTRLNNSGRDVVAGEVIDPADPDEMGPFNTTARRRREANRPSDHDPDPQGTARVRSGTRRYERGEG